MKKLWNNFVKIMEKETAVSAESNNLAVLVRYLSCISILHYILLTIILAYAGYIYSCLEVVFCIGLILAAMICTYEAHIRLGTLLYIFSVLAVLTLLTIRVGWKYFFAPTAFITIMVYFFSLNIPIRKKIHYAVFMSVYLNALAILKGKLPLQAEISGHAAMFILIFNIFFSTLAFSYVAYAYYQKFMASEAKILQYNKKLEQMASTDALTSLWNRRAMTQHLSMLSQQYVKHHMNFCVAILDIDFFKHVNDEHGHGMGDYVLKSLSYILKSSMEGRGQVARWGGEEFLLTFENTDLDRAYKLLDQIRARIAEQEFTFKDVSLHLTITGGIEEYSMTESIDAIITRADEKLYRGKTSGRNQIVA
ncbi:MAG: GGDEF domain-containing protein [Lachnospiraceae bacterium]|nr:GGDEF domain-containing protein [Lachnospiraceae bacterium]CCZ29248.1 signaling protein [Firmicutes bacterium CAG:194]